jgi:uncharacterized protein with GYD domain
MQRFIITMKLTAHGAAHIEQLPQFCDAIGDLWERAGGELEHVDITAGRFDIIASGRFPSSLHAMQFATAISSDGYVSTETSSAVDHRNATDVRTLLALVHGTLMPEKKTDRGD